MASILKNFDKWYVGLKAQGAGLPLGFMTPYEDNTAGVKRRDTVDVWARSIYGVYDPVTRTHSTPSPLPSKTVDAELLEGYRIANEVRRSSSWNGGNVVWRIEDPRGWELEISSSNLAKIIDEVGINANGLIPGKCIWLRVGANNVLVPETSADYQQMLNDARLMTSSKKLRTITFMQKGDTVRIKSGRELHEVLYLGQTYPLVENYETGAVAALNEAFYTFQGPHYLQIAKNSPVVEVVSHATAESIAKADILLIGNEHVFALTSFSTEGRILALLETVPANMQFRLTDCPTPTEPNYSGLIVEPTVENAWVFRKWGPNPNWGTSAYRIEQNSLRGLQSSRYNTPTLTTTRKTYQVQVEADGKLIDLRG